MKAIVTITAGLMIMSTTFAQSSRRSEVKENNSESNNRRTESVTERRTPSENSSSNRSENYNSSRRSVENSSATEKKPEISKNQAPQEPSVNSRSSATNRRNPSEESRSTYSGNNGNSSRSSSNSDYRQTPPPSQQSVNKNYEDNRREPRGDKREQVIVQEHSRRTVEPRHHTVVHKSYRPVPVEVRRVKYPYRAPVRAEIIWTVDLSRRFEVYYPHYRPHRYHYGMRLSTVSAYDAYDFVGEIARVYGRVTETYYAWETDEYFLYMGDYYPYHDFTVVIPGREARDFSRRPEKYFDRQYIEVTGLVSRFEGKPEMIIKRSTQIAVY